MVSKCDTRGLSVDFEAADPRPLHSSHIAEYVYYVCPLLDSDDGLPILVCDVEHTSFHFGLCNRKFVLFVFGGCPCLCRMCHSWQHHCRSCTPVSIGRLQRYFSSLTYAYFHRIVSVEYVAIIYGVPVHTSMSSAKRRLLRNSPSIFRPLLSQFNLLDKIR